MLVEHATNLFGDFREAMADKSNLGLAKSLVGGMGVDALGGLSEQDLQRLMDDFNALPEHERRAITDPAMQGPFGDPPRPELGAVRLASEAELRQEAASWPVLKGFSTLAEYLRPPGKVTTAKGNLKIADARELSELLGTGDEYEQTVGDHVFRKRSSTHFVELDNWQWWARESGAIRKHGNRLVAVKAWQQRVRKDPLAEVVRAFDVLLDYGVLSSYVRMYGDVEQVVDASVSAVLGQLLQSTEPVDFDDMLATLERVLQVSRIEPYWPNHAGWALDRMLALLERVGVVTQHGIVQKPREYVGHDRVGGQVALTPLGRYLAIHALRRLGFDIEVLPSTENMRADDFVALMSAAGPEEWWTEVWAWSATRPNEASDLQTLFAKLAEADPAYLVVGLNSVPDTEVGRLEPTVRRLAFTNRGDLAAASDIALSWLDQRGLLEPGVCNPERLADAHLDSWLAVATSDDDNASAIEMMREGRSVDDQLLLVRALAGRGRPAVAELLEVIGRDHPDQVVAKAARKELFRLRSRT